MWSSRIWVLSLWVAVTSCVTGCGDEEDTSPKSALWSKRVGREPSTGGRVVVAVDASGNVVLGGAYSGTVDLGGGPIQSPGGAVQTFLVKYSPDGAYLWSKTFPGVSSQKLGGLAFDAEGALWLALNVAGDTDFGGGTLQAHGDLDVALVKLDREGNHLQSTILGDGLLQAASSLALGSDGELLLCGHYTGAPDFGGGLLPATVTWGAFVVRLDASGKHRWSRGYTTGGTADVRGALAPDGSARLSGYFDRTIDLGGGPLTSQGYSDIFVAKLDAAGEHLWSTAYGGTGYDRGRAIAVTPSGDSVLTGSIAREVDLGAGTTMPKETGSNDPFVLRLDAAGEHVWSRRFPGEGGASAHDIAVDSEGGVLLTGRFSNRVDLGLGEVLATGIDPSLERNDLYPTDIFALKMASSGAMEWVRTHGNEDDQAGWGAAVDPGGAVVLAGSGLGDYDLGDGVVPGSGYYDVFVAKLVP